MTNLPHAHNLNYNTEYFGAVTGAERPQLFSTFSNTFDFRNFFKSILIFKKSSFLMTNEISEETLLREPTLNPRQP